MAGKPGCECSGGAEGVKQKLMGCRSVKGDATTEPQRIRRHGLQAYADRDCKYGFVRRRDVSGVHTKVVAIFVISLLSGHSQWVMNATQAHISVLTQT